jgi:hypothetical protein
MASNQKGGIGSLGSVMASITARDAQDGSSAMVPPLINDSVESDPVTETNLIKKPRQKKAGSRAVLSIRGLHLSDNTIMRLTILALERKTSLSQIADQILQSNLPDYTITKNKAG